MAHFGKDLDDFNGSRCIHIRSAEQSENFTMYVITLTVGPYTWTVKHRYSEFHELHEKLTASFKLDKSLLPPKKMFGNQMESFVKKRQRELEIYLQTILLYLAQHVPSTLAYFLDFNTYEIHGITQAMAEDLYTKGDSLLHTRDKYEVSSLQLYALTERLKLPEPTCDSGDVKKDLGHILDFITRAKQLKVVSTSTPVGASNIIMTKLPFDLTLFKSLQVVEIWGHNFQLISGLDTIKQTLSELEVHHSSSSMKEVLLQDAPHWRAEDGSILVDSWHLVTHLNLSHNSFSGIHESIQLMPNVEVLNLSHNEIETVLNLHWLSQLTHLDLSHNKIHHVDSLHTKMGNVKSLCLAHNQLESMHGFGKLFSLQTLDVSHNKITSIDEVRHISRLPCVENLLLVGNAVTSSLDYRTKTLEMFADRVREVILDHQRPDQKELDTVAVLRALHKAKTTKATKKELIKKNTSTNSLADIYSASPGSASEFAIGRQGQSLSPRMGAACQSIPPNMSPWRLREKSLAHSPFSQDSVSSHGSQSECEAGIPQVPEADPFSIGVPSPSSPSMVAQANMPAARKSPVALSNDYDQNATNNSISEITHELVPEAHPFDLSYGNQPSAPVTHSNATQVPASFDRPPPRTQDMPKLTLKEQAKLASRPVCVLATSSLPAKESVPNFPAKASPSQTSKVPQKRTPASMYSAADLPTTSDPGFVLWLKEQLLTSSSALDSTSTSSSDSKDQTSRQGSIREVLWCFAEQLSNPGVFIPCCAVLTTSTIFMERLVGLESNFPGVPELRPVNILPIQSIQHIVVGPCHAYFRLEEAFVGRSGTFTIFGIEPCGTKKFVDKLFSMCKDKSSPENLDCLDLSTQSDLLDCIVVREEQLLRPSDRLVVVALMKVNMDPDFRLVVLSENKVYCVDLDCVHWPPASFETSAQSKLSLNVLHEFSIMDRISKIKIHHQLDHLLDSSKKNVEPRSTSVFSHYKLTLEVDLFSDSTKSTGKDLQTISFSFLSPAQRDGFLDRLTNLRAEQAHRMSPSKREEPEGGNEQNAADEMRKITKDTDHLLLASALKSNLQNSSTDYGSRPSSVVSQFSDKSVETSSFKSLKSENSGYKESESDQVTNYFSSSPKEPLSISPMSNFSRASISPEHDKQNALHRNIPGTQPLFDNTASNAIRADSLPSSFDWNNFYFKSAANFTDTHSTANSYSFSSTNISGQQTSSLLQTQNLEKSVDANVSEEVETVTEHHLKVCVQSYDLINPLPSRLKPLPLMNGRELNKFFHSTIAPKTSLEPQEDFKEELHSVLWAMIVPYTNPKQEIITLVMLSSQAIYLVSDIGATVTPSSRPSWMTHSRNQSDSAITNQVKTNASLGRRSVKPYCVFKYSDLVQVNIGVFDQCVRLTGTNENAVFTIETRDSQVTDILVQKLKQLLSLLVSSPMVERSRLDLEQDFYRDVSQRTKTTMEGLVYTHPSQVNFVYPGDEAICDMLYLVNARAFHGNIPPKVSESSTLWFYLQCYLLPSDDGLSSSQRVPRSVIITPLHFALADEDTVTYPLPDFVRGIPENPCQEIVECRPIDSLKRVTLYHSHPHWLSLTFTDEVEDIVVDVSMQHFSQPQVGRERQKPGPVISYRLFIQSIREREKLVHTLEKVWKEMVSQVGRILDVHTE